jgi:hypothetical protein
MAVEGTSGARPPCRARWLAAKLTEKATMAGLGGGVPTLAGGSGCRGRWRRGPTSLGKGRVSEAHDRLDPWCMEKRLT